MHQIPVSCLDRMLIEIQSSEELLELLGALKAEGRQVYTLWHPRRVDRWLWKLDCEEPKPKKVVQADLGL